MKTTHRKEKDGFRPVTVLLTFETQEELDVYGCIFDIAAVVDTVHALCSSLGSVPGASGSPSLLSPFRAAGADTSRHFSPMLRMLRAHLGGTGK